MTLLYQDVPTELGTFRLIEDDGALVRIMLPGESPAALEARMDDPRLSAARPGDTAILALAANEIREYTSGHRHDFTVPIAPHGTPFQRAVWGMLRDIPYGETRSYAQLAEALGKPGAARAVGQANRRNPLPLVVPCHRVVAADGSLGGYMGVWNHEGGLKAKLLRHEGAWML